MGRRHVTKGESHHLREWYVVMIELCYLHWIHAKWDQPVRLSPTDYRILIYMCNDTDGKEVDLTTYMGRRHVTKGESHHLREWYLCYLHWIHAKWDQPVRLSPTDYRILIY
jgi:hypothetical protein